MKLEFCGSPLNENEAFNDADTGNADLQNMQVTEPVRLLGGPAPLSKAYRNHLIERFFNSSLPTEKPKMLREVGIPDDQVEALVLTGGGEAWDAYETALNANRARKWAQDDKGRPHLGLWGYRGRMVSVEGWEHATREEVVIRVKHFVLSTEAELARLLNDIERLERYEADPATFREPIPEAVQSFVWRRDGGRCVKCGSQERLEFDHIIPLAKGGSNTERNIQLLCEYHNHLKGAGDLLFGGVTGERPPGDES